MGAPLPHTIQIVLSRRDAPSLSLSLDRISTITPKGCYSLLSTLVAPSSGRRSPAGSSTLYVWINRREIVHSIFVRGTSRSVRGKSNGSDLFQGLCYVKVPQLSINFFRCERTTVERLLK